MHAVCMISLQKIHRPVPRNGLEVSEISLKCI